VSALCRGLIRDDGNVAKHLRSGAFQHLSLPARTSNVMPWEPLNQVCGACVGHGWSAAIRATLLNRWGVDLGWYPSPGLIYTLGLRLDRAQANHVDAPLTDDGLMIMRGADVVSRYGIVPMSNAVHTDVTEATLNDEISLLTIEKAATRLVIGARAVRTEAEIKGALARGVAVVQGGPFSADDYGYGDTPIGAQSDAGGHCTVLYNYDGSVYQHRNSWGVSWGKRGDFESDYAFIEQRWESWAVDVRVVK
jgi:hypothetical protein